MDSMYEIIMALPLFQGTSHEKISELIEKTKFHFIKFNANETIVEANDNCEFVRLLISGSIKITYKIRNANITVSSLVSAPNVIGIEYLFGKERNYPFGVVANSDCAVLQLTKSDYMKILHSDDNIFLFNLLNILSHSSQKSVISQMSVNGSVASRLAIDIMMMTQAKSKHVRFDYKQKDLCSRYGVQRPMLIKSLDNLKNAGMITYDVNSIEIADRDNFMSYFLK